MAVTIKSQREIDLMRESGHILYKVHEELGQAIEPGMSTLDIDRLGEKLIRGYGCIPNFLHYNGYPASICVSVNNEVVHGIPRADRILQEGDIVSLDAGLIYKGYHSDAARTYGVGRISPEAQKLIDETRNSFFEGIKKAKDGNHLHDISNTIDAYISKFGYGIVQELVGHGIGTSLHEDPQIPNFAQKRKGIRYFFQSPISSLGIRLIRGLTVLFFIMPPLPLDIRCRDLVLIDVVVTYRSITKLDNVIRHIPDGFVVRYHNDRVSVLLIDILNQLQDFLRSVIIERSGRLITKQNIRILHDRTSDRHTLLLSTGQLIRQLVAMLIQTERMQKFINIQRIIRQVRAHLDILLHIQVRNQIVHLEHITEMFSAVLRQLLLTHILKLVARDRDITGVRVIDSSDNVKQC